MNAIRKTLTRKIGPLPAWIWAVVVGVAVYWFRNRAGAGGATQTGPTNDTPAYYGPYGQDFNPSGGGGGTNGSGGGSGGGPSGGGGGDPGTAMPDIFINPPLTETQVHPKGHGGKRKPKPKRSILTAKERKAGDLRAPFGHKKPKPKAGYRVVGTGKGNWIYVPIHKPRSGAHKPPAPRPKPKPKAPKHYTGRR